MKTIPMLVLAMSGLLFSSLSSAEGFAVGAKVGDLGIGIEATKRFTSYLNGRVGFNKYTFDASGAESDIDYDGDFNADTITFLLDWHPFGGGFRATGGVMLNNNEIDLTAKSAVSYDIGGVTYTPAEIGTYTGLVNFKDVSPYLGIGWGNAVDEGQRLTFSFELGVLMQGSPQVALASTGGTLSSDPTFLANLATEEAQLEDDLSDYDLFPVISLGFAYQF